MLGEAPLHRIDLGAAHNPQLNVEKGPSFRPELSYHGGDR